MATHVPARGRAAAATPPVLYDGVEVARRLGFPEHFRGRALDGAGTRVVDFEAATSTGTALRLITVASPGADLASWELLVNVPIARARFAWFEQNAGKALRDARTAGVGDAFCVEVVVPIAGITCS